MPVTDAYRAGKANGIAERTLRRAKTRLGVRSTLVGFGKNGQWHWWLPLSAAALSRARGDTDTDASSRLAGMGKPSSRARGGTQTPWPLLGQKTRKPQ